MKIAQSVSIQKSQSRINKRQNEKRSSFLRLSIIAFFFVSIPQITYSQDFITEWTFSEATTELAIAALTAGEVSYNWSASPSSNSGSGTFNQEPADEVILAGLDIEAGDVVTIEMAPENLSRFYMQFDSDSEQLTDVLQWGDVSWESMHRTFFGCSNLDITASDVPDLTNVTDMSEMFNYAEIFNQDIGNWDVSGVEDMRNLFWRAESFNQDIGSWDVSNVVNMQGVFQEAISFNQDIGSWVVSNVEDMNGVFREAINFNQDIGSWDVSGATDLSRVFQDASSFDQDISNWDVSNAVDIEFIFCSATAFSQDIGSWDVSNVQNMEDAFNNADSFNQDIGGWDVSAVLDMNDMFGNNDIFNQDIGNWDVSSVIEMNDMFEGATVFNQDIGDWDVSAVEYMDGMFRETDAFNQDIGDWDVSNVIDMHNMFNEALSFNQDISNWDVSNVDDMYDMFSDAASFNQDIGSWILNPDVALNNLLDNSGVDCDHYSAILVGFRTNNPEITGRTFGVEGMQYGTIAAAERDLLIDEQGWTIEEDTPSEMACDAVLSVEFPASNKDVPIAIYPNPTLDEIVINGDKSELDQIRLFNSLGQDVTIETTIGSVSANEISIDLSQLDAGIYFVKTLNTSSLVVKE